MMKRQEERGNAPGSAVTSWFVLVLIFLFAMLSVALIALGTQVYHAIETKNEAATQKQTAVGYVLNRTRAFDSEGAVRLERMALDGRETDVLVFTEWFDDECYETRIYCADGALREQFTDASTPLTSAQDGEAIADLSSLSVRAQGRLLQMTFVHPAGETEIVHATLRSAGEEQP